MLNVFVLRPISESVFECSGRDKLGFRRRRRFGNRRRKEAHSQTRREITARNTRRATRQNQRLEDANIPEGVLQPEVQIPCGKAATSYAAWQGSRIVQQGRQARKEIQWKFMKNWWRWWKSFYLWENVMQTFRQWFQGLEFHYWSKYLERNARKLKCFQRTPRGSNSAFRGSFPNLHLWLPLHVYDPPNELVYRVLSHFPYRCDGNIRGKKRK